MTYHELLRQIAQMTDFELALNVTIIDELGDTKDAELTYQHDEADSRIPVISYSEPSEF